MTLEGAGHGLDEEAALYLRLRRFDPEVMEHRYHAYSAKLGVGASRVVFPYFDRLGRTIYSSARDVTGTSARKYLNLPGWHPLYVPWFSAYASTQRAPRRVDRLVVVEGVLDAIRVNDVGYWAAALGGKRLSQYLRGDLLDLVKGRVTVMLDSDAAADALRLCVDLSSSVAADVAVPPAGFDPAEMNEAMIREVLQ